MVRFHEVIFHFSVNTPHSWPHVVSFLVWLVELNQVSTNFNLFDAMYPEPDEGDMEINDYDFKVISVIIQFCFSYRGMYL